jgi:methionyl-tRNA formyltransferase
MADLPPISKLTILVNNPEGWVQPLAKGFVERLSRSYLARYVERTADVPEGDVAFFLGCSRIVPVEILRRNRLSLVIHGSDLPRGRGFSPIPWQVLEGQNRIPVVLFEAEEDLDSGPIYFRDAIELDGTELLDEIHKKTWDKIEVLITRFLETYGTVSPVPQVGQPSFYPRRSRDDDELDPDQTLAAQFDHLRIVDNDRYPAWFTFRGQRYNLKISKDGG